MVSLLFIVTFVHASYCHYVKFGKLSPPDFYYEKLKHTKKFKELYSGYPYTCPQGYTVANLLLRLLCFIYIAINQFHFSIALLKDYFHSIKSTHCKVYH